MTFTCKCCVCDYEDTEQGWFQVHENGEWIKAIYCSDCMAHIRSNQWKLAKENLLGVGCLASFRNILEHGLPTTLVERDVLGTKSFTPIFSIRNGLDGNVQSANLDVDLTAVQIENLVKELRCLDSKDVSREDIKDIASRYWTNLE